MSEIKSAPRARNFVKKFDVSSRRRTTRNIADDFVIWFSTPMSLGKFAERVPLHVRDLYRLRDIRRHLMDGAASAIDSTVNCPLSSIS